MSLVKTSGTSSLVTLSVYPKKTVGPSMVRNLSCSTCVTSVPRHRHFSLFCNPRLLMFPLLTNPDQFMWLLLAIPTINE